MNGMGKKARTTEGDHQMSVKILNLGMKLSNLIETSNPKIHERSCDGQRL